MYELKSSPIAGLLNAIRPCIVDVGARGGMDEELIAIAWACSVYGFEPEPAEAAHLQEVADQRRKSVKVLPYAVGGYSGRSTLYLPESEQGASLLRHNPDMVERFGYENLHIVRKEISVETVTLDSLRESGSLPSVDYLKIDIEGAELDVLKSGRSVLNDCSVLKIECSFLPQRISQPLIWDVAPFMIDAGFDVVGILDIHRWRRRPLPGHPYMINHEMPYSRGQLAQCDLIFLRRPDTVTDPRRMAALAIMSAAFGYFDYAISAMRAMPGASEYVLAEHGFNLESELGRWSVESGRTNLRKAIFQQLRTLVPQFRSLLGLLPYSKPAKPY